MVEIPDVVAKAIADDLRRITAPSNDEARLSRKAWADLLDPQPPTLREQVAQALAEYVPGRTWDEHADAVLAVVADWLAAQPVGESCGLPNGEGCFVKDQRDHDVRLLRGGS